MPPTFPALPTPLARVMGPPAGVCQPISMSSPEPFLIAVRASVSLRACKAMRVASPADAPPTWVIVVFMARPPFS